MDANFTFLVSKILSGEKSQMLCRPTPKWNSVRVGDKLTLYAKHQIGERRKLGEAIVSDVQPLIFTDGGIIRLDGIADTWLNDYAKLRMAKKNGFSSVEEFMCSFEEKFGKESVDILSISWSDFKRTE